MHAQNILATIARTKQLVALPIVRLSVRRNPLLLNGKGRYRESKQAVALKCIIQLKYVTEAFSLYSDIARRLPLFRCRVCSSILLILNMHRVSHAICMHVAVRVLHSCAFIKNCNLKLIR